MYRDRQGHSEMHLRRDPGEALTGLRGDLRRALIGWRERILVAVVAAVGAAALAGLVKGITATYKQQIPVLDKNGK